MGSFISNFKSFAVKGNAVDMAVGVIIGGAFGKIVTSIVNDIIMPPIGWVIGGVKFSDLKITLPKVDVPGMNNLEPATINYGNFIQTTFDFTIIALCVFILVRVLSRLSKKNESHDNIQSIKPAESNEERLLKEIRDLLKEQRVSKEKFLTKSSVFICHVPIMCK